MAKKQRVEIQVPLIQFKLIQIITTEFGFTQIVKKFEKTAVSVNYNIEPKIGFRLELSQMIVTLEVTAMIISTKESFFKASSTFVFEIANINDIVQKSSDNVLSFKDVNQKKPFIASLIGIAYSTMRGIIIEKGSGTILQTEFMPLIDPNVFIKEQI